MLQVDVNTSKSQLSRGRKQLQANLKAMARRATPRPDEKNQGDVTATFKTRLYPNGTETSHGPFTMSNPTSVRFQGRQVSMRIEAAQNNDWRVGTMRLDAVAGGKR